jgi:esterase/lipase superfamily enzyme
MNREYHKWYSPTLQRNMEMLIFGHAGAPFIVFPSSMGAFFEYEDRGMVAAVRDRFEEGAVQVFCVDSVDSESWYNRRIHPRDRVLRHMAYERYILDEVVPLIRTRNWGDITATGCSFGGYHALNIALRHPGVIKGALSMSGAFDIHSFLNGYWDDNCYFNCPPDYLSNLNDSWYMDRYREQKLVLATGDHDICLNDNLRMDGIMNGKQIPHWLDIWDEGMKHDWPWWRKMAVKFL